MSVCLVERCVYVWLTVQAFTVVLGEHREGDLLMLSYSKQRQTKSVTCHLLDFELQLSKESIRVNTVQLEGKYKCESGKVC